ncbi:hypothetical protein KCP75_01510 [Salmonella enterica subsp. enterica]|nr:hypothetical protein KCP75_01510 [Salmonella enterica subsp. enterica]
MRSSTSFHRNGTGHLYCSPYHRRPHRRQDHSRYPSISPSRRANSADLTGPIWRPTGKTHFAGCLRSHSARRLCRCDMSRWYCRTGNTQQRQTARKFSIHQPNLPPPAASAHVLRRSIHLRRASARTACCSSVLPIPGLPEESGQTENRARLLENNTITSVPVRRSGEVPFTSSLMCIPED